MSSDRSPEQPPPRVLHVGSEALAREALVEWETTTGGSVSHCQDLPEACAQPLDEYQAVLVDGTISWVDLSASLETLRIARNGTPLLVITESAVASDAAAALSAIGEDFVVPPYERGELVARLRRLHSRTRRPDSTVRFEDVEVDVHDRVCRVDGEIVRLTPKEFGILETLLYKAPHTVSREDLLNQVWPGDVERGRKAVDVHMTHLRQKLTGAYSRASVATVRGTGFRIRNVRVELPTHLVLDAAPDGMVVVDSDGEILMVNAMLLSMFGYTRADLVGATVETLIPERFGAEHHRHRRRFAGKASSRRMGSGVALFGRRQDGTEFPVDISLSPIETADGHYVVAAVRERVDPLSD